MNYLATFSGARYHDTTRRIIEDSPRFGVDDVLVYDDYWLKTRRPEFVERMKWFWEHPKHRGCGWFTFKPFYILDALSRLDKGDTLLALDADTFPIADLSVLFRQCRADGGVMLFSAVGCWNNVWSKRDAMIAMGCDSPKYQDAQHAVARFCLFQKGGAFPAEEFVGQWLGFTACPLINTFDQSVLGPELPMFRENRTEQTVLTNLAHRYGLKLYREACEFGNSVDNDKDLYGQLFVQDGRHTYGPGDRDESAGSRYRNVND